MTGVNMWQCGRCDRWNKVEHTTCEKCGGEQTQWAKAFQYHNVLTAQEEHFYQQTAPQLLREVRAIRNLIERMIPIGGYDGSYEQSGNNAQTGRVHSGCRVVAERPYRIVGEDKEPT